MVYYIVTSKPGKQSQMIKESFSSDSEVKATDLESVSKSPHGLAKEKVSKESLSNIALSFQLHLISSETGFLGIIFFQEKKYMEKLNPFYLSKINTGCEVKHPRLF